jgi:hypothetical protein
MTHDLLGQVIAALGATLRQVLITEHREDILFRRDGAHRPGRFPGHSVSATI